MRVLDWKPCHVPIEHRYREGMVLYEGGFMTRQRMLESWSVVWGSYIESLDLSTFLSDLHEIDEDICQGFVLVCYERDPSRTTSIELVVLSSVK